MYRDDRDYGQLSVARWVMILATLAVIGIGMLQAAGVINVR